MDHALPAVDVKLFREAYDVWYAAIANAPREESCMAGFAAVREIIDDDDLYVSISWRLNMLRDLISIPFIEQVRAHHGHGNVLTGAGLPPGAYAIALVTSGQLQTSGSGPNAPGGYVTSNAILSITDLRSS